MYYVQLGEYVKIKRIEQFDKTNKSLKLQVVDCAAPEKYSIGEHSNAEYGSNCGRLNAVYDTTA
jgi:hypothetical protein